MKIVSTRARRKGNEAHSYKTTNPNELPISLTLVPSELSLHPLPSDMFFVSEMPVVSIGIPTGKTSLTSRRALAPNDILAPSHLLRSFVRINIQVFVRDDIDSPAPEFRHGLFGCEGSGAMNSLIGLGDYFSSYFRHGCVVDCRGNCGFDVPFWEGGDGDFGCCCDFIHLVGWGWRMRGIMTELAS